MAQVRALTDALLAIRTPLIFWGFCAIVAYLALRELLRRNNALQAVSLEVVRRLRHAHLYRAVRLIAVCGFTLLLLLIVLAFAAPLIDRYISTTEHLTGVVKHEAAAVRSVVVDEANRIEDHIEIANDLREILRHYEMGELEEATFLIKSHFKDARITSSDEFRGYIVAAYRESRDYEKAIREVLERDKVRPRWDHTLASDLALCIRLYALEHSFAAAVDLVERLMKVYSKNSILTPFWAAIPWELSNSITDGIHSRTNMWRYVNKDVRGNLRFLLTKYPNDEYAAYALYLLADYENALERYPRSRFGDVLLYARAYQVLMELQIGRKGRDAWAELMAAGRGLNYAEPPKEKFTDPEKLARVENAIRLFRQYIELYPGRPHADDSAHWIAWLEAARGHYRESFEWLKKLDERAWGNGDYKDDISPLLLHSLRAATSGLVAAMRQVESGYDRRRLYQINVSDAERALWHFRLDDAIEHVRAGREAFRMFGKKSQGVVDPDVETIAEEVDNANSNGVVDPDVEVIAEQVENANSNGVVDPDLEAIAEQVEIVNSARKAGGVEAYAKAAIVLRRKYFTRSTGISLLKEGIERYGRRPGSDLLRYLLIVNQREHDPAAVKGSVDQLLASHPNSALADDALAELIYVKAYVLGDRSGAEQTYAILERQYPDGNALDNSLNWIAYANYNECLLGEDVCDGERCCQRALQLYGDLIDRFPFTRFAVYAQARMREIQKAVEDNESARDLADAGEQRDSEDERRDVDGDDYIP